MTHIFPDSLYKTIDSTQAALFSFEKISEKERRAVSTWLADRQGLPGSYRGMFAPTEKDFSGTVKTFTGEVISSRAARAHILSEEACRLLLLLDVHAPKTDLALKTASESMLKSLREDKSERHVNGRYCCDTCSISLWRHLAAGGLREEEGVLEAGIESLVISRDGKGRWRSFPFYYTLLILNEVNPYLAKDELKYALPAIENAYKRLTGDDEIAKRRKILLERTLLLL